MARNRNRWAEYTQQWKKDNAQLNAETMRTWREANTEERQEYMKQWMQDNRYRYANYYRKRKLQMDATELTPEEAAQIQALYMQAKAMNEKAGYCAFHIDHIIPLAKGGAHHPDNLQILTAEENLRKGAKLAA